VFVALAAVLAVAPFADADQPHTVLFSVRSWH
jgi:hypothetical protein